MMQLPTVDTLAESQDMEEQGADVIWGTGRVGAQPVLRQNQSQGPIISEPVLVEDSLEEETRILLEVNSQDAC